MEWVDPTGALKEATFTDTVTREDWSARLRTALDPDGNWLPTVLTKAEARLTSIRGQHPDAGGLVIATDHEHAHAITTQLAALTGESPALILSDDPRASTKIGEFSQSDAKWVVAVRMISEGVDVPRLRVAVFASTTTTALFFRQAVGRIARWIPGYSAQPSYFFIPDDHRLRQHAATIAMERRHSIDKRPAPEAPREVAFDDSTEQMSLFSALSSSVVDEADGVDGLDPSEAAVIASGADLIGHPFDLPPPPPLAGRNATPAIPEELAELRSRFANKRELRDRNADRARTIARLVGWEHRAVNGELNRRSGVHRITEATAQQLERRLAVAEEWLDELTGS